MCMVLPVSELYMYGSTFSELFICSSICMVVPFLNSINIYGTICSEDYLYLDLCFLNTIYIYGSIFYEVYLYVALYIW